jgi:hypothetical protein
VNAEHVIRGWCGRKHRGITVYVETLTVLGKFGELRDVAQAALEPAATCHGRTQPWVFECIGK